MRPFKRTVNRLAFLRVRWGGPLPLVFLLYPWMLLGAKWHWFKWTLKVNEMWRIIMWYLKKRKLCIATCTFKCAISCFAYGLQCLPYYKPIFSTWRCGYCTCESEADASSSCMGCYTTQFSLHPSAPSRGDFWTLSTHLFLRTEI